MQKPSNLFPSSYFSNVFQPSGHSPHSGLGLALHRAAAQFPLKSDLILWLH